MTRASFANVVQGVHVEHNNSHGERGESSHGERNHSADPHSLVLDNTHPLYLHNNENPCLILIAKKLTGPDNYAPWSRSMRIALNARNKFCLVNGTYEKPDDDSTLCVQWERANDMVITWILNSVTDEISDGLSYVTTAQEIWNELFERFSSVNGHHIFQILKDTHSLDQGTKSVESYFHKLKSLWDEYVALEPTVTCVCGAHKILVERDQKRKLLQFLMGLHDSHANVRGQILMMNPLPTVSQAYAYVKQDERARQGPQSWLPEATPLINSVGSTGADNCKKFSQNKVAPASVNRSTIKCSYCNFNGHSREQCYKLIGYPPNWKKKDKSVASNPASQFRNLPKANATHVESPTSVSQLDQLQQQINQLSSLMTSFVGPGQMLKSPEEHMAGMVVAYSNSLFTSIGQDTWLIDTGATDHMCCSLQLLTDIINLASPVHVALPTGSTIMVW